MRPGVDLSGGRLFAPQRLRFSLEEQRLGDCGGQNRCIKGFGDEIVRLRPFPRQQSLWKGGNKDNGHIHIFHNVFDGINAAGAIGQADIGEHQLWRGISGQLDGFVACSRNAADPMPNIAQEELKKDKE